MLMLTDTLGTVIWCKTYDGGGTEVFETVRPTHDRGYIATGYTTSFGVGNKDAILVKLDSNGTVVWLKTYGTAYADWGRDVIETADRGFVFTGSAKNSSSNPNTGAVSICRTDSLGALAWCKMYGAYTGYEGVSVFQDGAEFLVSGNGSLGFGLLMKLRSDGSLRWSRKNKPFNMQYMNFAQLIIARDGNYYFTGWGEDGNFDSQIALMMADTAGIIRSQHTYSTPDPFGYNTSGGLCQTWDDKFIISGLSADSVEASLFFKTDTSGMVYSSKIYPGPVDDSVNVLRFSLTGDDGFVCATDTGICLYKMDGNAFTGCSGTSFALVVDTPSAFDFDASNLTSAGVIAVQSHAFTVSSVTLSALQLCSATAVEELPQQGACRVFPNPSDGVITLSCSGSALKSVRIYDITGRLLYEAGDMPVDGALNLELPAESGMYLLEVFTQDGPFTARVVRR
jgi:hypothetical protein